MERCVSIGNGQLSVMSGLQPLFVVRRMFNEFDVLTIGNVELATLNCPLTTVDGAKVRIGTNVDPSFWTLGYDNLLCLRIVKRRPPSEVLDSCSDQAQHDAKKRNPDLRLHRLYFMGHGLGGFGAVLKSWAGLVP